MNRLRLLAMRLRAMFAKREMDRALDEELESHLEMLVEQNVGRGMPREEARRAARLELGGADQIRELVHDQRGLPLLESLRQDVRYGARMLRKSPGFTSVAVLTLALGIGANTAIFSVVNAVLLRPLPFPESDRVLVIWWGVSIASRDWPNGTSTLERLADYEQGALNLTGGGPAQRIPAAEVSDSFFRVFSLNPILGRTFIPEEQKPGHAPVVLLSHNLWRTRYQSDPRMIGKPVYLNGKPFTVIGILPQQFDFPAGAEAWVPLPPSIQQELFGGNGFMRFQIARLRAAASVAQVRSEMEVIQKREVGKADATSQARVQTLHEYLVGNTGQAALMLFGAVGFVLLIACADVANLLLARGADRAREVAVRRALGASRARLVRQFLSESILLSLLGGAVGLLCGQWAIVMARVMIPPRTAFATRISLDHWALGFTCAAAVLAGIVAGTIPALHSTSFDLSEALKEGARSSRAGFSLKARGSMRTLLGVSEIAVALILVVGATLFLRSLGRLLAVNSGFRTDNVLIARLSLLGPKYETSSARAAFLQQVLVKTRALHGVQAAACASTVPLDFSSVFVGFNVNIEGGAKSATPSSLGAMYMTVSPDYFRAMRIPLLAGRDFSDGDASGSKAVVIVSRTLAQNGWPDRSPLGGQFAFEGEKKQYEVVGVVDDVKHLGLSEDAVSAMYFPAAQDSPDEVSLLIHTDRNPLALSAAVREAIRSADSDEPIASFNTMDRLLSQSVALSRFRTLLLGIFGAIALLLALVGIYGVISCTVAQRTHEIGIRVALGARQRDVLGMVAGYGLRLAATGLAIGLTGAYLLARLASSFLYGIQPTDPLTFVLGSAVLIAVVLLASYIPARRAMRVDPMVALRYE